jgi:Cu/Ag efflux pump CusA
MILVFLGSPRATVAVCWRFRSRMLVCLLMTNFMGGSINTMILGGLALVFSRLIDNGVIVLENIFRTWKRANRRRLPRQRAAPRFRWRCWPPPSPPAIVFFPVTSFSGVSKYIFTPLALGVVLSIFASYFFAMTVVPLFCAKFIRQDPLAKNTKVTSTP